MSEEKDIIDALGSVGETLMYRGFEYEAGTTSEAASEITRLRGEAEAREVEITALVESAREAQQLYVQADNESLRLRGEVERLTTLASREGWVMVPREPTFDMVRNGSIDLGCRRDCTLGATRADQVWTAMLSAAPKPEEG